MNRFWDTDISNLDLSDTEKNGLQVFRNYQRALNSEAEKKFAKELDALPFDTTHLTKILTLVSSEDPRFLPVIACAYADDLLKEMFKRHMPSDIPGGVAAIFGPYGPISTLFNRIQLAFVFDQLSADILWDIDRTRRLRNDLSHKWDVSEFEDFFTRSPISDLSPVDTILAEYSNKPEWLSERLEPLEAFRIRMLWILARLTYETNFYPRAKLYRLDPHAALYGANHPKHLSTVAGIAVDASKQVVEHLRRRST